MDCSNQYCYWNYDGSCCTESEESFEKATPNELDCPSSMRNDFEKYFWYLKEEIESLLNKRNFKELHEIHIFIKEQRKVDIDAT